MNRRRWLMGLVVVDALCWAINVAPSLIGGRWNLSIVINGRMLSDLLFDGVVVLFPIVIGASCSRRQAAVALPVIAASLGGVGWLLRYARAEFAASTLL